MSVLQLIINFVFGRKYYACILNVSGTQKYDISCFIFTSTKEVEDYKEQMKTNLRYSVVKVISFRSRMNYGNNKK